MCNAAQYLSRYIDTHHISCSISSVFLLYIDYRPFLSFSDVFQVHFIDTRILSEGCNTYRVFISLTYGLKHYSGLIMSCISEVAGESLLKPWFLLVYVAQQGKGIAWFGEITLWSVETGMHVYPVTHKCKRTIKLPTKVLWRLTRLYCYLKNCRVLLIPLSKSGNVLIREIVQFLLYWWHVMHFFGHGIVEMVAVKCTVMSVF